MTLQRSDFPELFRVADQVAQRGQRGYMQFVALELLVVFLAAFLGDLSDVVSATAPKQALILLLIALLAFSLIMQVVRFSDRLRLDQRWFHGRAVAESVKTSAWRYMMKAPPYDDGTDADLELTDTLRRLGDDSLLSPPRQAATGNGADVTAAMRATREATWTERRQRYFDERLDDQINWYGAKAAFNARRARLVRLLSFLLQIVALGNAIWLLMEPSSVWNLVGVWTTLAASVIAWSQARRYDDLQVSYAMAHQELEQIRRRAEEAATEDEFIDAVVAGEGAVSREHTMWVAKSGTRINDAPRPS